MQLAKRDLGDTAGGGAEQKPARKRRRVKTYQTIMHVDNILAIMAETSLAHDKIKALADGTLPDPLRAGAPQHQP